MIAFLEGIAEDDIARRRETVYRIVEALTVIEPSQPVLTRAAQPLPVVLGTLDAIHLATALLRRERSDADLADEKGPREAPEFCDVTIEVTALDQRPPPRIPPFLDPALVSRSSYSLSITPQGLLCPSVCQTLPLSRGPAGSGREGELAEGSAAAAAGSAHGSRRHLHGRVEVHVVGTPPWHDHAMFGWRYANTIFLHSPDV